MMDWGALTTQELVEAVRHDPCATERDLALVEKIAVLIDELDAVEDALRQVQRKD